MTIGGFNNMIITPSRSGSAARSSATGQATRGGVTVAFEQAESARSLQRGMRSLLKLEGSLKELRTTLQVPSYRDADRRTPTSRELGLSGATASTLTSTGDVSLLGVIDPNIALSTLSSLDPGELVVGGAFDLNGTTIGVGVLDTLNDVISRINNSGAGVTASWDGTSETITLTHDTLGANGITVSGDTSGFLSAFKLDGALTSVGELADADKKIQDVAALAGISTGTASINGVSVSIDVANDSLNDVISRINGSGAGATASLQEGGQRFVLEPDDDSVALLNETSNLFDAMEVTPLSVDNSDDSAGRLKADLTKITRLMRETSNHVNALFKHAPDSHEPTLNALTDLMRKSVSELLDNEEESASVFNRFIRSSSSRSDEEDEEDQEEDGQRFRTRYGVHFNFREGAEEAMILGERELQQLRTGLQNNSRALYDFFKGDGDEPGLLDTWISHLKTARQRIQSRRGSSGLLVSLSG
ncbi:MAG: hypothetical protein CMH57_11670 [Myxococcales bacterium]|nr:hypothetical protein [Myxococcales bacterium]